MEFTDCQIAAGDFEADERRGKIRSQVVFFLCLAGTIGRFSDAVELQRLRLGFRFKYYSWSLEEAFGRIMGFHKVRILLGVCNEQFAFASMRFLTFRIPRSGCRSLKRCVCRDVNDPDVWLPRTSINSNGPFLRSLQIP